MQNTASKPHLKYPSHLATSSLHPTLRVILAVFFVLAGLYCTLNTVLILLATIAIMPALINFSVFNLFGAIIGFISFTGTAFIFGGLTAFSFIFAHHLFKKQPISLQAVIFAAVLFVLNFVFRFVLLPLFGSTFGA